MQAIISSLIYVYCINLLEKMTISFPVSSFFVYVDAAWMIPFVSETTLSLFRNGYLNQSFPKNIYKADNWLTTVESGLSAYYAYSRGVTNSITFYLEKLYTLGEEELLDQWSQSKLGADLRMNNSWEKRSLNLKQYIEQEAISFEKLFKRNNTNFKTLPKYDIFDPLSREKDIVSESYRRLVFNDLGEFRGTFSIRVKKKAENLMNSFNASIKIRFIIFNSLLILIGILQFFRIIKNENTLINCIKEIFSVDLSKFEEAKLKCALNFKKLKYLINNDLLDIDEFEYVESSKNLNTVFDFNTQNKLFNASNKLAKIGNQNFISTKKISEDKLNWTKKIANSGKDFDQSKEEYLKDDGFTYLTKLDNDIKKQPIKRKSNSVVVDLSNKKYKKLNNTENKLQNKTGVRNRNYYINNKQRKKLLVSFKLKISRSQLGMRRSCYGFLLIFFTYSIISLILFVLEKKKVNNMKNLLDLQLTLSDYWSYVYGNGMFAVTTIAFNNTLYTSTKSSLLERFEKRQTYMDEVLLPKIQNLEGRNFDKYTKSIEEVNSGNLCEIYMIPNYNTDCNYAYFGFLKGNLYESVKGIGTVYKGLINAYKNCDKSDKSLREIIDSRAFKDYLFNGRLIAGSVYLGLKLDAEFYSQKKMENLMKFEKKLFSIKIFFSIVCTILSGIVVWDYAWKAKYKCLMLWKMVLELNHPESDYLKKII